jgi:hypothetical protein
MFTDVSEVLAASIIRAMSRFFSASCYFLSLSSEVLKTTETFSGRWIKYYVNVLKVE